MRESKYYRLTSFLLHCGLDEVTLSFAQIEEIIGGKLPDSAKEFPVNWANTDTLPIPRAFRAAGYATHDTDMKNGIVHFTKVKEGQVIERHHKRSFSGESGNVILLNKPFLGGWLDTDGHIGHEIIDFLLADDGSYYIYNNPWGACPEDIWVEGSTLLTRNQREKFVGKYMILTSETRNKDFDILYVIELQEKLHRVHTSKKQEDGKANVNTVPEIIDLIHKLDVKYNGRYLYDIFENESLCLTFRGAKIYKAEEPISVTGLEYNFQRNKGYIYDSKNPQDYEKVIKVIEDSINSGALKEFQPRKVNHEEIGDLNANKTFLDLISMQDSEQVYTNILHSVLSQNDLLKRFCQKFKEDKDFDDGGVFSVLRETKVVDGRMDVCADSENQRVIIENKVYSGLNGLKPADNKTQLSTYYEWGKVKPLEPLCFVVAPNFRVSEIKKEIHSLDTKMEPVYIVKTYGDIADFIEEEYKNGNIPSSYIYYSLVPQIINAFRNYSYTTREDLYARKFLEATN